MKLQLIHIDNYLVAVDDAINHPIDCMYRYIYIDNTIRRISSIQPLSGVNLIIYHLPLNNAPVLEGIKLLPPLEVDLDDLARENANEIWLPEDHSEFTGHFMGFKQGYNKAKEDYKFTEEDMVEFANWIGEEWSPNGRKECWDSLELNSARESKYLVDGTKELLQLWKEQQPKLPTSFDTETKQYIYATHN